MCIACPVGSYCLMRSARPLACPAGTYSNATGLTSEALCLASEVGHWSPPGSIEAKACATGSFVNESGSSECTTCPGGTFQNASAAAFCFSCKAGSFCPEGGSLELAAPCQAGTFVDMTDVSGNPSCLPCKEVQKPSNCLHATAQHLLPAVRLMQGFQCLGSNLLPKACPRGTWAPGQVAVCTACALSHATTLSEAARAESDCCCASGFYLTVISEGANATRECIRCPDEAGCDEPGIELMTLPVKRGFWRVIGTSTSLLRCPTPDACAGGSICSGNVSSSADCDENPNNMCAKNHRGPLCQVCVEGTYKPTRAGLCISCGGGNSTGSYAAISGLMVGSLAAVLLLFYVRRRRRRRAAAAAESKGKDTQIVPEELRRPTMRKVLWRRLMSEGLRNKVKLVISLFQVIGSFDLIFDGISKLTQTRPLPTTNIC